MELKRRKRRHSSSIPHQEVSQPEIKIRTITEIKVCIYHSTVQIEGSCKVAQNFMTMIQSNLHCMPFNYNSGQHCQNVAFDDEEQSQSCSSPLFPEDSLLKVSNSAIYLTLTSHSHFSTFPKQHTRLPLLHMNRVQKQRMGTGKQNSSFKKVKNTRSVIQI